VTAGGAVESRDGIYMFAYFLEDISFEHVQSH
jgi:hypothetical protein